MLLAVVCLWLAAPLAGPVGAADDVAGRDPGPLAAPGPYAVEAQEVVVTRPGGDGEFDARLFIPRASSAGAGPAAVMASPIVAFGHGFLTPVDLYESTLRHLASWGITTIAPRSAGGPLPDHAAFAADLSAALEWVAAEAAADEDWPGLPVDAEARGTSGHSMGGGAAVLAAANDARIGSVATLAAADTRPSSIDAAAKLTVPALFIAASQDGITPVAEHQQPMADAASMAQARLHVIEGGSHCGFLDRVILPGIVCDEADIDPDDQRARAQAALVGWFHDHLGGEPIATSGAGPDATP